MALIVIVLQGAILRQQLINFDRPISQNELATIATRLNEAYSELSALQIRTKGIELSTDEQQITDCLLKIMQTEDNRMHEEPYLDGLHYLMNQPEFITGGQRIAGFVGLIEQRQLMDIMLPKVPNRHDIQVFIGKENREEVIQDCSVIISRYGLSDEAVGTIGIVGPTRMPYARTISTIGYMTSMMSRLVAELYGREMTATDRQTTEN
jgi:heat-inducible transcriptional repressor